MKNTKKTVMRIAIILLLMIIIDSIMPILSSQAGFVVSITEWLVEKVFTAISRWLVDLGDLVLEGLQRIFVGNGEIAIVKDQTKQYAIRYSPGIIFSGKVPGLDVNFISPMKSKKAINTIYQFSQQKESFEQAVDAAIPTILEELQVKNTNDVKNTDTQEKINLIVEFVKNKSNWTSNYSYFSCEIENKSYYVTIEPDLSSHWQVRFFEEQESDDKELYANIGLDYSIEGVEIAASEDIKAFLKDKFQEKSNTEYEKENDYDIIKKDLKEKLMEKKSYFDNIEIKSSFQYNEISVPYEYKGKKVTIEIGYDVDQQNPYRVGFSRIVETDKILESSAEKLKESIATWYKVMMEIALVGLLSVLVYISIRMILTSVAEDKAKYKKMLSDWVAAVCIIFLLHYLMSITFTCTQAINDIFNANIIGEDGEDILMTNIRNEIANIGEDNWQSFANNLMYLVLVILTVMFTYQYLKRFIYMAFLTMIAPLIALTYPLDKVKDGKAQAYGMWLREFVFLALIQPVHLVLYYVILGVSNDLIDKTSQAYNPLYAIVAISFLLPAEKFIRKMFGFDKTEASNTIGSALGGAALMNAINKLGSKGGSKEKKSSGGAESGGETTSKTRMANSGTDPYEALRGGNGASTGNAGSGTTTGGTNSTATTAQTATGASAAPTLQNSATTKEGKFKKVASGVGNVAGKYGRKALRGVGKVTGAAALGTIGLAGGIATGDMSNAFAGLAGGIVAGKNVGGNIVDGVSKIPGAANGVRKDIVDTFREGAYGKDEAARIRFDKEFKKSEGYKNLIKENPGAEGQVEDFLAAGITDTSKMGKAIKSGYSTEEAIAYMKLASTGGCPDEVLYDENKFKTYLDSRGIDSTKAEEIRKGIVAFK